MKPCERLIFLIDLAKSITGSDAATSRALDIPASHIAMWRNGDKNPQPEDWSLLASISGIDPHEVLEEAVLFKLRGKHKGEKLKLALGRSDFEKARSQGSNCLGSTQRG